MNKFPLKLTILTITLKLLMIMMGFVSLISAQTNTGEITFRIALKDFQSAVLHKDLAKSAKFMNFPFCTSKADVHLEY